METALVSGLLKEGGWFAVLAFLLFFLFRLEKRLDELEKKLENSISREDYYRDISGWRSEIQRLEDKITRLTDKILEVRK